MRAFGRAAVAAVLLAATLGAAPAPTSEARTAAYLDHVRTHHRAELMDFIARMPKGGDLHHHLTGAVYAESYIRFAVADGDCIDATGTILAPPCDPASGRFPASRAVTDFAFRNRTIDALSDRNFHPSVADDDVRLHFFEAFDKFDRVTNGHWGEMFAEVVHRAAAQHEIYLETMLTPDQGVALKLASGIPYTDDFAALRAQLLAAGMANAVTAGTHNLDVGEAGMRSIFACGTAHADPGCDLTLRYQYQVLRAFPKVAVFAQMLAGFEMASRDPRVVGINLVQSQDEVNALADFALHMRMLNYLHGVYPAVHITLHAGELTPGQVPPEELRAGHIRMSIDVGHAERIGHGLDVLYEPDPPGLLAEMARKHILLEDCLYSHEVVRGMYGRDNVLPVYLAAGVPVSLATDDEGVIRADLTASYIRAVEGYGVGYTTLKRMVRDSLDHAFVAGASLWRAPEDFTPVAVCARDTPECRTFLGANTRARLEWNEEAAFRQFEARYARERGENGKVTMAKRRYNNQHIQ